MEKTKKKFKVPHSYVIITCILLLVSILTYVIPAGEYTRTVDETGTEIIHTDDFNYVEQSGVSPLRIPSLIMQSLSKQSEIIFSLLVIGGAFEVVLKTGMFQAYLTRLSKRCGGKGIWLIPLFTLLFGVLGMTQAANKFIAFAPVGVLLASALKLDAIVGVAMVLLGSGVGFSTGILQPTTALAQEIAGLPAYSGIGMRIASFILFYLVTVKPDFTLEPLVPVVRGELLCRFHCHTSGDIATAIRIAREFNLKFSLEHVTEGFQLLPEIRDSGAICAIGPLITAPSKREIWARSLTTPAAFEQAGIPFCLIQDGGVMTTLLPVYVGLAIKNGLSHAAALQAVTTLPARLLGIEHRVGSLEPGKDADIAIFDGDPFSNYTHCRYTVVDGQVFPAGQ